MADIETTSEFIHHFAFGGSWRERARQTAEGVVRDNPDATESQLRRLLYIAYPFGERRFTPYKIWCEEVRRAKGTYNPTLGKREQAQVERYAAIMAAQKGEGI